MTAINVLYELAEEFMDIIIDEYAQYADNPDVKALPKEVDRFITIGSTGLMPQNASDQLTVYIGAPFPGIAQQGDSTVSLTPNSVLMAVDLTRCYPQPDVSQKGGRIMNDRFINAFKTSTKQQSNDLLILRDATKRFYELNGAGVGAMDNITTAVGQDTSGAIIHLTTSVPVLLARKSREINGRN